MKRFFLLFSALLAVTMSQAQGLNQVVVEVFDPLTIDPTFNPAVLPAGAVTYRVYAELQASNDRLVQIIAEQDCTAGPTACVDCTQILINTTTSFYNNPAGGGIGTAINPFIFGFVPGLSADSWLTIGNDDQGDAGVVQTIGEVTTQVGACFGNAASSNSFLANDGQLFSTPDQPNTLGVGPNNRVLLGQFTTDGDFSFGLNLAIQPGGVPGTPFTIYTHGACFYELQQTLGLTYVTEFPSLTFPAAAAIDGCTNDLACNWNPAATNDDGSCVFPGDTCDDGDAATVGDVVQADCSCSGGLPGLNDVPAFASVLDVAFIGDCSPVSGDVDAASIVAPEATTTATPGLWYRFTAVTAGVRVSVETADFDAVLELQDQSNNLIDFEDVNLGNGNEVLNIGSLTAGQDYFVRVAPASPTSGAAQFDICVEWLPDTQVDVAVGVTNITRSLCQNSKADWVDFGPEYSVSNYIFTFLADGFEVTTETGASFTIMPLTNVPGLSWEGQYEVAIDVELVLADGSGALENVLVENTTTVGLTISAPPSTNLRPSDNLANAGPLFPGSFIWATPFVCGVDQWEWEFTSTSGGLPIPFLSAGPSRLIRLSDVEGLMPGEVYDVRVRPVFNNGYVAQYGAVDQIAIIGAIGMAPEIESPVVVDAEDAERNNALTGAEFALYPNPNNGELVNINLSNVNPDAERILVDIYDSFGKLVLREQIANAGSQFNVIMPLDGLAAGVYTVSVIMNDQVRTERMIVQR